MTAARECRLLIVNADDFGFSPAVSDGILRAVDDGIVTSTTVMTVLPGAIDAAVRAAATRPHLGWGVHLVGPRGAGRLGMELGADVATMWRTQIEAALDAGLDVDHLDSHYHEAFDCDAYAATFDALAVEFELAVRADHGRPGRAWRPDTTDVSFYDVPDPEAHLVHLIQLLGEGTTELMCHPGWVDDRLLKMASYCSQREGEVAALTSPRVRQAVVENDVQLATFRSASQHAFGTTPES